MPSSLRRSRRSRVAGGPLAARCSPARCSALALTLAATFGVASVATAAAPDLTPPSAPVLSVERGTEEPLLRWTSSVDDVGVSGYEVEFRGNKVSTTTGLTYAAVEADACQNGQGFYRVRAVDLSGNVSAYSNELAVYPPWMPTGYPAPAAALQGAPGVTSATIGWPWSGRYAVTIGGQTQEVTGSQITLTGLQPDTEYTASVRHVPICRGDFAPSADVSFRTAKAPVSVATSYDVTGQATVGTLVRGSFPVKGALAGFTVPPPALPVPGALTTFEGDLALAPARVKLLALGLLPVTADLAFIASGKASLVSITDAARTEKLNAALRVRLPRLYLFGAIPIGGGANCQTRKLVQLSLPKQPGTSTYSGPFELSDLSGCGAVNGIISPFVAGAGNKLSLTL